MANSENKRMAEHLAAALSGDARQESEPEAEGRGEDSEGEAVEQHMF